MYKYIGMGLLGLFIMMVLPSGTENINEPGKFYGAAHLLVKDAAGNEVFSQTIHNRLLDSGENFINNQVFTGDGAPVGETGQMSAICVSNYSGVILEGDIASTIAGNNGLDSTGLAGTHCHPADILNINADGTVVLGPEVFTGGFDIAAGEIINSIAICSDNADTDYSECDAATTGNAIAFAEIQTSAVQLGDTETVDITYTFDLSSDNT